MDNNVYPIPLGEIHVSDLDVRHTRPDTDIQDLAESIAKLGQLQPVVLRGRFGQHTFKAPDGRDQYELIIGQRRYLALQRLRRATAKAVFAGEIDKTEAMAQSLAENLLRVKLNHADAAEAVTDLYRHYGDMESVHRATGMSLTMIRKYLDVRARASERMLLLLQEAKVSLEDLRRCLDAAKDDAGKAERLLDRIAAAALTGPEKERMVEYGRAHPRAHAEKILEEALRPVVERRLTVRLPDLLRAALQNAVDSLSMEPTEVVALALQEWLQEQGFTETR